MERSEEKEVADSIKVNIKFDSNSKTTPCLLCDEEVDKLVSMCGNQNCSNLVCFDCAKKFYSEPKKGGVLTRNNLICPLCRQVPHTGVSNLFRFEICNLILSVPQMEDGWYYGWCKRCNKLTKSFRIECTLKETPRITNYQCVDCNDTEIKTYTKACPKCKLDVQKIEGCNHIECRCGTHWCYVCGYMAVNGTQTLRHMKHKHGTYFHSTIDYNYMIDDDQVHNSYPTSPDNSDNESNYIADSSEEW